MEKVIYKVTSPANKIYIGQTKDFRKRKSDYKKNRCKSQIKIYHSILKHGWENHTMEIIETIQHDTDCQDITNQREKYWIQFYDSINSGLNILEGGGNGPMPEEVKEKLRQKNRYKSEETMAKWRTSNPDMSHNEETKKQISQTLKDKYARGEKVGGRGSKRSEEYKQRQRDRRIQEVVNGKDTRCKKIGQYDMEGNLIKIWDSIGQAVEAGYQKSGIILVCKQKRNRTSCNGFKWKYE